MKQIVVIGLGRFGMSVAETMIEHRCQVLAIDSDMEKVKKAQGIVTQAVQLDARDPDALKAAGVSELDSAVVAIGSNMESSMLAAMLLKELGVKHVIAKATTLIHGRFLEKIGADQVVYPEIDSGRRLGRRLAKPNIVEQMDFGWDYGVFEIAVPKSWAGKTIGNLNVRAKYGISVLAVQSGLVKHGSTVDADKAGKAAEQSMKISPLASTRLSEGDTLLVLGHVDEIKKLTG